MRRLPLRASAALAILVGLVVLGELAYTMPLALKATARSDLLLTLPGLVTGLMLLIGGLISLWRLRAGPPIFGWGWVLGWRVPHLLNQAAIATQPLPPEVMALSRHDTVYLVGPDYVGLIFTAAAFVGLALCVFDYYEQKNLRTA
jgi:hypothetical protein